jgi:serine/threonine protein kinase
MQRSRSNAIGTPEARRSRTYRVGAVPAPARRPSDPVDTMFAAGSEPGGSVAGATSAVEPGTLVGNYRVVELLAAGGMGEVYLGQHIHLGRAVAIKFLHQRLLGDREALARFAAEARAVSHIRHPGVVALFDFGPHDKGAYLVMELLAGETLTERLERAPRLPPSQVIGIGFQLAEALAAAHQAGIVHRDLKPDNIVLVPDPTNGIERAVLLDFGVAKVCRLRGHTMYGDLLGTPFYMAPEQSRNASTADERSDVYALGCVLYRLLAGRVPFRGNLMEILLGHQQETAVPLRAIDPYIPPELEAIIARMMAKAPEARPAGMTEVARALGHLGGRRRPAARRSHIGGVGAMVAAALVVAGLGHFTAW